MRPGPFKLFVAARLIARVKPANASGQHLSTWPANASGQRKRDQSRSYEGCLYYMVWLAEDAPVVFRDQFCWEEA